MKIAIHITHEALKKIGGIGSVLSGICTISDYKKFYDKTVFYGPMFELPGDSFSQLGKSAELLFSSHDNYDSGDYSRIFADIIEKYNIDIAYGKREVVSEFDITKRNTVEVINVGINRMNHESVEQFKYVLWKNFGIKSHLYEDDWDYEQYLRIAIPYIEILEGLYGTDAEYLHFAHEYMGIPSALSVLAAGKKQKTTLVAHEVTTARAIVENEHGHDISFYNILQKSHLNKSLEQVFGSQEAHSRTELVKRAVHFDHIFAVGDHVKDEYLFLSPETPLGKIKVVYNGISAKTIDFEQKQQARNRVCQYIESLFNFVPDAIFTHVTRLVISKGLWRDIELLYYLDEIFHAKNLKGAYILLSTVVGTGRNPNDVFAMEHDYGWPVLHREGWPDLIGAEKDTYNQLQVFNSRSKAIKGVFINQFGFDRSRCGKRIPEDSEFSDTRIASDAEFGLSIYEPFGIAQIETIPFGGISVLSSSCGSAKFIQQKFNDAPIKPFCIVDYISAGRKLSYNALKNLTINERTEMERSVLSGHAKEIFNSLPLTDDKRQQYLSNAQKHAHAISWEASAQSYISCFNPST